MSLYELSQNDDAWPLLLIAGGVIAAVMKADQQVRAYKVWKREWDAMSGAPASRARTGPRPVLLILGILLALPLLSLLTYAGQHGGSQAATGIFLLFGVPVAVLAGLVQLWRRVRRGRAKRVAQVEPVTVSVTRPILPVPSLREATLGLPDHCRAIMAPQP
jgi:hypothetical protein